MKFDLVIKNGTVVRSNGIHHLDVGIQGESIIELARNLSGQKEIDAQNLLVIPGGIDPHVHLEMPAGEVTSSDDWGSGTIAAAIGGTTTVIDFVEPEPHQTLQEALNERRSQADSKSVIDYSLHMTIVDANKDTIAQIPQVIQEGVTSFKLYTTYDFRLSTRDMLTVMEAIKNNHGLPIVHAENDAMIQFMQNKLLSEGHTAPRFHPISRPALAEADAVGRVLAAAELVNAPVYIVHVSSQKAIELIQAAWTGNQPVFAETCPQYLLLTDEEYQRPGFEAAKYICSPPLRKVADQSALWQALKHKTPMTVGTDHCPFFYKGQKDIAGDKFTGIPGGIPGIESRLSLIFTFGVQKGYFDVSRWVEICCTNPAKIFGLYPHKGDIQPGSDADIVLFDPNCKEKISASRLHENVDYSPYEEFRIEGKPNMTISRGKVIAREGNFLQENKGRFIPRKPNPAIGEMLL